MNKLFCAIFSIAMMCFTTACSDNSEDIIPLLSSADTVQENENITETSSVGDEKTEDEKEASENMINIQIGANILTATLAENSSAEALLEMLSEGPVTIEMSDYAGMEKVGTLPSALPVNDEHINTDACDLILYQGDSFVIYYDTNSWSLTRLGKINNITKSELKDILGTGDVTVVLSISSE